MSHNHMSMGSAGVPAFTEFPKYYYAVVGCTIGVATLVNIYNYFLCKQRLSAARRGLPTPAKPKTIFSLFNATIYALMREASNFSIRISVKNQAIRLPTVGRTSLVLGNVIVLIVLCLYGLDLNDRFNRENVGYRCGMITLAQLPLIFLLAGKNNIIGFLSGVSHERLNWLHRWCARCMLLTATLHMGYFFGAWAPYDFIGVQLRQNRIVWKGLAAWCVLVWIVFSSMSPIRGWSYEVFIVQHLISFTALITFIIIHVPADDRIYIWVPVALFFFDRLVRALRVLYANVSLFHPAQRKQGKLQGLWACRAEFTPLPHNTTRVVVRNPPISWTPGQHVFLSCHSILPLQSHPFTISSIPEDGKMEFLIKSESGGTKRFFQHAERLLSISETSRAKTVAIEGPYGCLRPLRQFDSVILFAGSTGATFTVPLLRDILQGWRETLSSPSSSPSSFFSRQTGAVTRHIRFVWIVKSRGQFSWFSEQLSSSMSDFQVLQEQLRDIKLEVTAYITCDDTFTEEHKSLLSAITAPTNTCATSHGAAELRNRLPHAISNEAKGTEATTELTKTVSHSSSGDEAGGACGVDGDYCCCRVSVDESSTAEPTVCNCNCTPNAAPPPRRSSTTPSDPSTTSLKHPSSPNGAIHPSITLISGRPKTKDLIRRSLEQARGESAVVVCGPRGLVRDVKQQVVEVSDERAVHKGSGAQGVWVHTESFGY